MKIAIYLYFLFRVGNCFASDTLSVRYLGIDQGLSNNAVTCIYKDHNGFMWFGTYDGLNRYDGYSFRVFRNAIGDSASLLDNHVFCINSDNENKVWAGGGKGISVYDPNRSAFFTPRFKKVGNSEIVPLYDAVLSIKNAVRSQRLTLSSGDQIQFVAVMSGCGSGLSQVPACSS